MPLYLYDGAYHETVAYQSLDLLQRDRDELDKDKALDELLTAHDGDRVRTRLSALEAVHLCDGDLAIRQALAAAASAQRHGEQLARWSGLHLSAFASAARYDRLFMSASELYRLMLAGYDDEHGTELVRTAEALVNWHGDVKAIAEELHQHPNTVRYRMRKMKAVLGIPHEDDKVFINLLSLVFLPELG